MEIFAYLLLQIINGEDWKPKFSESKKYKNWISTLDFKTCYDCRKSHGKIWKIDEKPDKEPPLHTNCRCSILIMKTIKAGTATINNKYGADWTLKYQSKLPDYYIDYQKAKISGFKNFLGNLGKVAPDCTLTKGEYKNRNGHLPNK
ncbi:MAG: minor capsid protein [Clostridia bacterium]|nr:minor capsid protein [Clostridia bacterium]